MIERDLPELSERERQRYARHLVLPSIGEAGQRRLKGAGALIVGVGGLGSSIAMYLAAAGVGRIGLVDDDVVTLSNLQRQVVHGTGSLGVPKSESARRRIVDLNPDIEPVVHAERFTSRTGQRIASGYDLIVDGTDNFQTRYAINDVCLSLGIPYVYGAIFQLQGQVSVLCTANGPCYRCLFPKQPESAMSGERAGILGVVPGTIGTLQATETIKWIVGIDTPLVGRLLVYDAARMHFEEIAIERHSDCPTCGPLARSAGST